VPVESIKVPDLGDSKDVEVIELLVKVGQTVSENDSLLVLESDKAAMEIPSPRSGVVKSISVKLGDQISEGHEILKLEVEESSESAAEEKPADAAKAESSTEKTPEKSAAAPAAAKASDQTAPKTEAKASDAKIKSAVKDSIETIKVPDLGDDSEVEVIEIHVKPGDEIAVEDSLITLESDKAAMDIPSPQAGIVKSVKLKAGDKVSAGSVILELQVSGASAVTAAQVADHKQQAAESGKAAGHQAVEKEAPSTEETAADQTTDDQQKSLQEKQQEFSEAAAAKSAEKVYAGPAVRKLARELGVDLTQLSGTGAKGRILKEDINKFVKDRLQAPVAAAAGTAIAAVPDIDFSQFGDIEQVQMSKLHKLTAINMQRSWNAAPHVFQFNEADITELEEFRTSQKSAAEKKGLKLTLLPFLLKACAKVLQEHKQFNVSLHSSGEYLIQKKYIHIGVAVATEAGLVVPVVRNVDQKNIWEIAEEVAMLSDKAKQRRLTKEDMQGACFTISSLGAIGGTGFTPIVNTPEVAILGVSRTSTKPVYINGEFVPRQMLPLTLSYDHRAVNGVDGGMFATLLAQLLGDIRLLVL
jgi:pyruvate dehydrogenase E2 component (dihydrolipoamide acetyltransferase)